MIPICSLLSLCVLDLSRIDLATSEDKLHRIDYRASLFKSTTWEEIKMLAKDNDSISDAASTVYQLSQEKMIRLQCEAREDYYRTQNDLKELMKRRDIKLSELDATLMEKDAALREKDATIEK